jgi:hypothetical protein
VQEILVARDHGDADARRDQKQVALFGLGGDHREDPAFAREKAAGHTVAKRHGVQRLPGDARLRAEVGLHALPAEVADGGADQRDLAGDRQIGVEQGAFVLDEEPGERAVEAQRQLGGQGQQRVALGRRVEGDQDSPEGRGCALGHHRSCVSSASPRAPKACRAVAKATSLASTKPLIEPSG